MRRKEGEGCGVRVSGGAIAVGSRYESGKRGKGNFGSGSSGGNFGWHDRASRMGASSPLVLNMLLGAGVGVSSGSGIGSSGFFPGLGRGPSIPLVIPEVLSVSLGFSVSGDVWFLHSPLGWRFVPSLSCTDRSGPEVSFVTRGALGSAAAGHHSPACRQGSVHLPRGFSLIDVLSIRLGLGPGPAKAHV